MPRGHYPTERRHRGAWDPAPLLAFAEAKGWDDHRLSDACGISTRQIVRYRAGEHMVTDRTADRAAVALGLLPHVLWPDWFDAVDWSDLDAEEAAEAAAEAAALEAEAVTLEQLTLELAA